jgi:hypothetical protein
MPSSEPRKHHVVPAFYLAGFTQNDSSKGVLHVFDYTRGKRYESTPRKACRETDFYRVEEPGIDSNLIEKVMSLHESAVTSSVQLVGSGDTADRPAIAQTLALAALLAVRSRPGRQQMAVGLAAGLTKRLQRGEVSREQWDQLRTSELRNGATPDQVPEYDEALTRLLNGEWFPRAPTVLVVGLIPGAQEEFRKLLMGRRWETHVTDATANGGFICSDSPLVWGNLDEAVGGRRQSVADHDIEITFPVSRKVALVSHPGAREARCSTTDEVVAHVNMRTLQLSAGMVFHAYDDFLLRRRAGDMRRGSEYFAYVADARRRGIIQP